MFSKPRGTISVRRITQRGKLARFGLVATVSRPMTTDFDANRRTRLPAPLVALAGWLVPGAGYWIIGERARALVVLVSIVTLYVLGLLIAGVRVVEVPGYGKHGYQLQLVGRQ